MVVVAAVASVVTQKFKQVLLSAVIAVNSAVTRQAGKTVTGVTAVEVSVGRFVSGL